MDKIDELEYEEIRRRAIAKKEDDYDAYIAENMSGMKYADSPMCQDCISEYKILYVKGMFVDELSEEEELLRKETGTLPEEIFFPATCFGDNRCGIGDVAYAETDQDFALATMENPDSWFKEELNIELRWYQSDSAGCSARMKVDRWGRRCLPETEMVRMIDDTLKSIKDIKVGDQVLSTVEDLCVPVVGNVTAVFQNGIKPVYKITLEDGRIIRCTSNHPIYIYDDDETVFISIDEGLRIGSQAVCLHDRSTESYTYSMVESIEYIGEQETYDITVDEYHNFLVDGIVTHNTGKTHHKVGGFLQRMQKGRGTTEPDTAGKTFVIPERVLVLAPFQAQVDEIFEKIDEMLIVSKTLSNCVEKRRRSPNQVLQFTNRSKVIGFCTGANQGTGGDKTRGQDSTLIYVDEADYVQDNDIESFIAIVSSRPDTELWFTSTPSGRHGKFWSFCMDKMMGFKERHICGTLSPSWNRTTERFLRRQYSKAGWDHEILAVFGDVEGGVFATAKLNQGLSDYDYNVTRKLEGAIHTIGVDWNGVETGIPIIVIAYYPDRNSYVTVDKYTSKEEDQTQTNAVKDIIKMFHKWGADAVYVDAGFGCLDANTLILTDRGMKKFSDINPGDMVMTHASRYRPVLEIGPTGKKRTCTIEVEYNMPLISSPDHRHCVYRGDELVSIKSSDLLLSDQFIIPKQSVSTPVDPVYIDLLEDVGYIENCRHDQKKIWSIIHEETGDTIHAMADKTGISSSVIHRAKSKFKYEEILSKKQQDVADKLREAYGDKWYQGAESKIERKIDISSDDFQFVLGWILCHAKIKEYGLDIEKQSHHSKESFSKLIMIMMKWWPTTLFKSESGEPKVQVRSAFLSEFFACFFGYELKDRHIDTRVLNTNPVALVKSIFGCTGAPAKRMATIGFQSKMLAFQVRQILIDHGILSDIKEFESGCQLFIRPNSSNLKATNSILGTTLLASNQPINYIETPDHFLVKLESVSESEEMIEMYDMSVEEDESFWANGICTHNSTQVEMLKKYAIDFHEDGLLKTLKGIHMQGKTKIRDPYTRQNVQKQNKALMTDLAVQRVESGYCYWPAFENQEDNLVDQLRNYKVDRYTPTGLPVYSQGKDHELVAWVLAMFAIVMEFSDLCKIDGRISTWVMPLANGSGSLKSDISRSETKEMAKDIDAHERQYKISQGIIEAPAASSGFARSGSVSRMNRFSRAKSGSRRGSF